MPHLSPNACNGVHTIHASYSQTHLLHPTSFSSIPDPSSPPISSSKIDSSDKKHTNMKESDGGELEVHCLYSILATRCLPSGEEKKNRNTCTAESLCRTICISIQKRDIRGRRSAYCCAMLYLGHPGALASPQDLTQQEVAIEFDAK